jgi:hypothetical protein
MARAELRACCTTEIRDLDVGGTRPCAVAANVAWSVDVAAPISGSHGSTAKAKTTLMETPTANDVRDAGRPSLPVPSSALATCPGRYEPRRLSMNGLPFFHAAAKYVISAGFVDFLVTLNPGRRNFDGRITAIRANPMMVEVIAARSLNETAESLLPWLDQEVVLDRSVDTVLGIAIPKLVPGPRVGRELELRVRETDGPDQADRDPLFAGNVAAIRRQRGAELILGQRLGLIVQDTDVYGRGCSVRFGRYRAEAHCRLLRGNVVYVDPRDNKAVAIVGEKLEELFNFS